MTHAFLLASLLALQATPATPPPEAEPAATNAEDEADIEVVEQRPAKITDKDHPDYVRCKSESIIGSRAKRKRTCMTNKEWELVTRRGNESSREFVGDNQPGFQPGGP